MPRTQEIPNISGLEVELEWQAEPTLDYMYTSCAEGKGLKSGEECKMLK